MVHRPRLALVPDCGAHRVACRESSFNAASPLGSELRPCSKSHTDDGDRPTESPISSRVMPRFLRSRMRDDHVFMPGILRNPVSESQRHSVTVIRETEGVGKFHKQFKRYTDCRTLGDRVGWWREERSMDRRALAKLLHIPYSSLSEIENNGQQGSAKVPLLATGLRINAHYLATGEGDPLDIAALPAVPDAAGELARMVTPELLSQLTQMEFELAQFRVRAVVEDILSGRKATRSKKVG
jgi:hypothetical protein